VIAPNHLASRQRQAVTSPANYPGLFDRILVSARMTRSAKACGVARYMRSAALEWFNTARVLILLSLLFKFSAFPPAVSAATPSAEDIISNATRSWNALASYDATYELQYMQQKDRTVFHEVWTKAGNNIAFYRFEVLHARQPLIAGPYLQIRNSAGTWEMDTNHAFNTLYASNTPFRPGLEIMTNGMHIKPDVGEATNAGIACFVVTMEAPTRASPADAATTVYDIGETDYLCYRRTDLNAIGRLVSKLTVTALKANQPVDQTNFALPAGLPEVLVTNLNDRLAYLGNQVSQATEGKKFITTTSGRRISKQRLIIAGFLLLNTLVIMTISGIYAKRKMQAR